MPPVPLPAPSRLLAVMLVAIGCALAPGLFAQETTPPPATQTMVDPQTALDNLIVVLRDEAAREALIADLQSGLATSEVPAPAADTPEADAAEPDATEPEEAEPETVTPSAELRSWGARIADITRDAVGNATASLATLWTQLVQAPAMFSALDVTALDALWDMMGHFALLAIVTYGGLLALRAIGARTRARLRNAFATGGWVAKPVALLLELVLDLVAVLVPYGLGYGVAVAVLGTTGEIEFEYSLYLNAFVLLEAAMAVIRTIVSPQEADQRLLGLTDKDARATMIWSRLLIGLFVFGQFMVLPLVNTNVSFPTGRAVSVVILLFTLALACVAVMVARKPVRNKLMRLISHREMRQGLRGLITHWYVLALIYIGVLAVVALTRTPVAFQSFLWSNVQIALAILAGIIALNVLKRGLGGAVALPEHTKARYPQLQRQLNAILPMVFKLLRVGVIAGVILFTLSRLGVFGLTDILESELGARITGSGLTIALILLVASLAWIGVNAWIDGRVNPEFTPTTTARHRTLFTLMRNALTIAIIVITLMLVLSEVGINIAPLLASAGVVGLAVGFGAQRLVQDIITGIFIQLEGAIDVGDVVSVAGISGVVERLTIRSVSLRDSEGSYHVIPFSTVAAVTNFMRGFSFAVVDVTVPYSQSVDEVKAAMAQAFATLKKDPSQGRYVKGALEWEGVNTLSLAEIGLRARIKTAPGRQWGVKRSYNALLRDAFIAHFVGVPQAERPSVTEAEAPAQPPQVQTIEIDDGGNPAEIALPDPDAGPAQND